MLAGYHARPRPRLAVQPAASPIHSLKQCLPAYLDPAGLEVGVDSIGHPVKGRQVMPPAALLVEPDAPRLASLPVVSPWRPDSGPRARGPDRATCPRAQLPSTTDGWTAVVADRNPRPAPSWRTHGLPPKSANRDLPTRIAPWRRRPDRRDRRFRRARLPRRLASRRFLDQRRPRRPAQADLQVVNRSLAAPRTRAGRSPSTTRSPAWTAGPDPSGSPRRGRRGPFETTVAPSYVQDKSTSAPDGGVAAACPPAPPPPPPTTARPAAAAGRQAPAFGATGLAARQVAPAPPRSAPTPAGRRAVAAARAGR